MRQNVHDQSGSPLAKTSGSHARHSIRAFRRRGVTSIVVLLMMFVAITLMLSLAGMAMGSLKRSTNEKGSMLSLQVAQTIMEYMVAQSYEEVKDENGNFYPEAFDMTDLANDLTPGATAILTVQPMSVPTRAWFTSTATYRGKTSSIRSLVTTKDVSIWNNAIFAGTGAGGRSIEGNVDIRGGVHILGDGEPFSDLNGNGQWDGEEVYDDVNGNGVWDPGEPWADANGDGVWNSAEPYDDTNWNGFYDPPIATTDFSGNMSGGALIGNNYSGMPVELEALIPALQIINGQETLEADLRIKHGLMGLSGTATAGQNYDPDGGTSKGALAGVYVSDGFGGNQGASSVFSDNGSGHGYDLGHLGIVFPYIEGLWAPEFMDEFGVLWDNQKLYLDNRSMTIPLDEIDGSTEAFSYGPDLYGNSITYMPGSGNGNNVTPGRLDINGIIKIDGNFEIDGLAGLRYTGSGTFYVTRDVYIGNDILPEVGYVFPTDTSLGIIAGRNMNLATGNGDSQLSMAGAFYAQGTVRSPKQNNILGTFVANFFDMGKNVPNIWQVPTLVDNMPPGMPGDVQFITIKLKNWRERKGD
ncbi:MAG: hypothetical protein IH944_04080 [Armatimonadetes bacterium]|nr:hypothetical protein [Armatimonadota bacterium]